MKPGKKKRHPLTIEEIEKKMDRLAADDCTGPDGELPIPEYADGDIGRRGHLEVQEAADLLGFGSSFRMEDYG